MNTYMNMLGFKLVHVEGGTNEPLEVNASPEWASKISENREEVGEVAKTSPNSRILFLRSLDSGTLIGVARSLTLTDRGLGCVVGWIYIPYNLIISGQEINSVVDFVSDHITSARIDGDAFRREFSKTYGVMPHKGVFLGTEVKNARAFRYYGKGTMYTLAEILSNLNQPEYRKYSLVMLLDKESGVSVFGQDLTNTPLVDVHIMTPPTEICGFTPYIAGMPFVQPIFVSSNEKVHIVLRKPGYKDITKTLSATDTLTITPHDTMRVVEAGSIRVWDEATRRPVENCVVSLNGQPLPAYVSDGERRQVSIKVDAPGYHTYRGTYDLDRSNGILLKKAARTYIFQFRLKNGDDCRFSIETMNDLHDVPFRGYVSDRPVREGIVNYLEYKPSNGGWLRTLIIGVAGLLVGLGLGIGSSYLYNRHVEDKQKKEKIEQEQNKNKKKSTDTGTDNAKPVVKPEDSEELDKAIEYLDKNAWVREEMEDIEMLKGFYDALNTYDVKLILKDGEKFNKSNQISQLLELYKRAQQKSITFPSHFSEDGKITYGKYLKKVRDNIVAGPGSGSGSGSGGNGSGGSGPKGGGSGSGSTGNGGSNSNPSNVSSELSGNKGAEERFV